MSLKIFNTLTRRKETFEPIDPPRVKMYVCGPTVYDLLHIGNFRGAVFFNLVRNCLEENGYEVTFVYNYTDIDDKIINRAREENTDPFEIGRHYIEEFERDFNRLKLRVHDANPRCTESMEDMVGLIEKLVEKNHAYVIDGSVFYSIKSFEDYGKLSRKNVDELEAGHRVDPDPRKKNALDFVLWKPSKEGEPAWDSPWGKGRPGWHLECSTMIYKFLGESIDIHGGGIDLTFPHHENEIAQSEAVTGKPFVKYWMHNNFINFGSEKMSKSLGNVIKARDFMERYHPEILKYLLLSVHYRSFLKLDEDQIQNSIAALARIYGTLDLAERILDRGTGETEDQEFSAALESADGKIAESLNDDFNTPAALGVIFEEVRRFNAVYQPCQKVTPEVSFKARRFREWIRKHGRLMALFGEPAGEFLKILDTILVKEKKIDVRRVEELIASRNRARSDKDFVTADRIRDELAEMEIVVHDGADGTTWEVKKT